MKVDAFVGGLVEDSHLDSSVGELFYTSIQDQFQRLRNHDRFYFENAQSGPFKNDPDNVKKVRATGMNNFLVIDMRYAHYLKVHYYFIVGLCNQVRSSNF